MYTGSYRMPNTTVRSVLNVDNMDTIDKGQLVALNVENCNLRPMITHLLEVSTDTVDIVWLEGSYTKSWKVAKKKEGCTFVDWADTVPKSSIILFDFQLTKTNRLRKATIQHLKVAYTKLDHYSLYYNCIIIIYLQYNFCHLKYCS